LFVVDFENIIDYFVYLCVLSVKSIVICDLFIMMQRDIWHKNGL